MFFRNNKFPIYRQYDKMDCGPTCLRMIAAYYGKAYSQEEMMEKCKVGRDGVTIYDLGDCAKQVGFETLPAKVTYELFKSQIPLPCIAYFNSNHFVVVFEILGDIIKVADPGGGIVSYPKEAFLKRWNDLAEPKKDQGVVLVLKPNADFNKPIDKSKARHDFGLAYVYTHLKANWKDLVLLSVFLLAGTLLQLVFPLLTQAIVDRGIKEKDLHFIYLILFAQLALVLGRTTVEFGRRWVLMHVSNRINISIVSNFLSNLMRLTIPFFDQRLTGDILRRIDDNTRVERFLSTTSFSIIFAAINLVVYSFLLASYNLPVLFTFIGGSILYMFYILQFMKRRKQIDYMKFGELARTESGVIELIEGIRDIKINNSQNRMNSAWKTSQFKLFKLSRSFTKLQQLQDGGGTMINEIRNVIITFLAAQAVMNGSMTLGMMLAMQYVIGQLHSPIGEFLNFTREYQEAKIGFERMETVHRMEKEDVDGNADNTLHSPTSKSSIDLINVCFNYGSANSRMVLNNISVSFLAGQVTAIVGESGSGKTTLLNLLLKFYRPTSGVVIVGENDLKNMNTDGWRARCGVVMQNGYIFSDTIERNIALSSDTVDQSKLANAIQVANLQDTLKDIPNGVNAVIGSEGQGLSAGQKQRILIARAVYKNPDLFLFDEATSSLDATNEGIIMQNLMSSIKGKTAIIIAHRLSTVIHADKIIVLEKGEVKEVGTHKSLITLKGSYHALIKNQLDIGD